MKTIGLIGGVSWESSREYYRLLNEFAREAKGGLHSAPVIMHSFDFAGIAAKQKANDWDGLKEDMALVGQQLENAGAQAIVICSNYMHRCAEAVETACKVPLLHITQAVGEAIKAQGQQRVGLMGAAGTMELPFYRERLAAMGIECLIPDEEDRKEINRVIFEELCRGQFTDAARKKYCAIMEKLAKQGAQGIVLGCTEIEQLIRPEDTPLYLYPAAELHARAIATFMLGAEENKAVA